MRRAQRARCGSGCGCTRARWAIPPQPPIVWQRAEGATVWDADGRAYTDLSSGFGVAAVGHRNPRVVAAIHRQADLLLHGLGDLHPTEVRVRLAERLAEVGAVRSSTRALFHLTGAGAIELAHEDGAAGHRP